MPYIASTLTADNIYTDYHSKEAKEGGPNKVRKQVLVKGGANVANQKNPVGNILTPRGVVTHVSDDDLAFLQNNEAFKTHLKNSFVQIIETRSEPNADKAARDMTKADAAAPLTEDDYKAGGRGALKVPGADDQKAPVSSKVKKEK